MDPSIERSLAIVAPKAPGVPHAQARTLRLQFVSGGCNRIGVLHLELETDLRNTPVRRPLAGTEARTGGLRQRPYPKVLAAIDMFARVVVAVSFRLERQPEGVDVELAAPGGSVAITPTLAMKTIFILTPSL